MHSPHTPRRCWPGPCAFLHLPGLRDAPGAIGHVPARTFQNAFKGDLVLQMDCLGSTVLGED